MKKLVIQELLEFIPDASEIKQAIFEEDMDEKMLDEWLFNRIFKNDFLDKQKQQMIDFANIVCEEKIDSEYEIALRLNQYLNEK